MNTLSQTSRFLMQSTLGADQQTVQDVSQQGIDNWLNNQLNSTLSSGNTYADTSREIWQYFRSKLLSQYGESAINGESNNPALPYKWYFHMAWWQHALNTPPEHLLRQRIAQALSEILVISDNSQLELDAVGMGSYYDLLYKHAFGNYSDLLYDVSMHPCMGVYLSHMNNRKAEPARHIHPDENYAREIMQLFTIGLYELNPDGSRKTDASGRPLDSYNNDDIKELARVFTGLKASGYEYEWNTSFWESSYNGYPVSFDDGIDKTYKVPPFINMTKPMAIDEDRHDRGSKQLLKGRVKLPAGQGAEREIRSAVKQLVAHPNTAPFIATHLINQLVTSNPSKAYVKAVAAKFGKEGNLKAVIREILTYPQKNAVAKKRLPSARQEGNQTVQSQKLKSPLLRATQILRAFRAGNRSGKLWLIGDDLQTLVQQHPLSSPTVFNFYKPDFAPHGPLELAGFVAPEFELHTSATSIAYVNMMYYWFFGEYLPAVSTRINSTPGIHNVPELDPDVLNRDTENKLQLDFSAEIAMAKDPASHSALIDRMSLLLTGTTDLSIKPQILEAFKHYRDQPAWVVQTIAFMLTISPEFTVLEA
ncbi:DUF1800 family protein [Aliamphritea spongicola]|uniref:DUF1800 family protein n=1 Tax=Aliamphritea spongicola TaxID=707589 RepID=UPI00196B85CA|nr:DUF1800 family protein [Aliamphritea spongicola]MBN3561961.1 DUF1800 family protein [Aliamphritea spongicola]